MRGFARSGPKPKLEDPYLLTRSYPEPTVCLSCGLVYHNKRWTRDEAIFETVKDIAEKHKCPACRKIADHFAMGIVVITGKFLMNHSSEIKNLIKNQEKKELLKNPLSRIMSLKEKKGEIMVETTSENLALSIGKALHRAYNGTVDYRFSKDEKQIRVYWKRDERR